MRAHATPEDLEIHLRRWQACEAKYRASLKRTGPAAFSLSLSFRDSRDNQAKVLAKTLGDFLFVNMSQSKRCG